MPPLTGKRVLITRTRRQSSALAAQLEEAGAITIAIPSIEIAPPESYSVLDQALSSLESYEWLLFTSANAVEVFAERRLPSIIPRKIAAIGPATAKAIQALGLNVDLVPLRYVAESFAEALTPHAKGNRMLLVRAEEARDVLPEALITAGADLTVAAAYRNQIPLSSIPAMQEIFANEGLRPDVVTLTSASTARSLVTLLDAAQVAMPRDVLLASIGPITTSAICELGYVPAIEAEQATISALVEAIAQHFVSSQ